MTVEAVTVTWALWIMAYGSGYSSFKATAPEAFFQTEEACVVVLNRVRKMTELRMECIPGEYIIPAVKQATPIAHRRGAPK